MSAPPPSFKLTTLEVVLGDPEDPTTWDYHTVVAIPADETMAGDLIAKHKQWPGLQENPFRFTHAKAFYALKRTGRFTGSWEAFEAEAIYIENADEEEVPPTQEATGADSAPKSP